MLFVAFLIGLAGLVLVVVFDIYSTGMLLAGLSLGMVGMFLVLRRFPPR